jgi:GAF domain-containing protein
MPDSAQSLSLERKIKMHEAREGIINRLAMTLPHAINLDRFLTVIVSELGRMMNVDRCDVIQLKSASELRISHEWRASNDVPSSLGTVVPLDLKQLSEHVDLRKTDPARRHLRLRPGPEDSISRRQPRNALAARRAGDARRRRSRSRRSAHDAHAARMARRRSLVSTINRRTDRDWLPVHASLHDKEREAETKRALLSIANALNARSDFGEVSSLVLERAIALVGADYCALGVLDPAAAASVSPRSKPRRKRVESVQGLFDAYGQSLDVTAFPAMVEVLAQGKTLRLLETDLPFPRRLASTRCSAAVRARAPVRVGGQTFGCSDSFGARRAKDSTITRSRLSKASRTRSAPHSNAISCRRRSCTCAARCTSATARNASSVKLRDTSRDRAGAERCRHANHVLIEGESGTGKELLANLIHFNSGAKISLTSN